MKILTAAPGPIHGECRVPGDKSISHRVALMAPLAAGESRIRGWLDAADTRSSLAAVEALGAEVTWEGEELVIGPGGFPAAATEPVDHKPIDIDCGNSGTTTRLLLGLLAPRNIAAHLFGDASLTSRPMTRVGDPLARLGADITADGDPGRLPLILRGRRLKGSEIRLSVRSAQVKSALLLAGLGAHGPLTLHNAGGTRDHTERLLAVMGADIELLDDETIRLGPGRALNPFDVTVPGDPSSAAFLIAAALMVPGSKLTVRGISLAPARTGFLDVLRRMGAKIEVTRAADESWEPVGDVHVEYGPLRAFEIEGNEVPSLIDELPILAVLATRAEGRSTVTGAGELRVKESDRIASVAAGLRKLGVEVDEAPDGFALDGAQALEGGVDEPAVIETAGDHRLAMSFAVAALAAEGRIALDDSDCVAVSWPGFFGALGDRF